MNIIYKITNLDNGRYYIGSKFECRIEFLHNRNVIVCNKSDNIYFGSSSNAEMKKDLKVNVFNAEILEIVPDRSKVREKEQEYLKKYDVLNDKLSYNLTDNAFSRKNKVGTLPSKSSNTIMNIYGETLFSFGQIQGQYSRMMNTSKKLGFKNIYFLAEYIYNEYQKCGNFATISRSLNLTNRHFAAKWSRYFDFKKSQSECFPLNVELQNKMIFMFLEKSSYHNISKTLNVELSTVSFYLQEFIDSNRAYTVAANKGKTHEELSLDILKLVLQGETVASASVILNITRTTGYRYFYDILRKRLKVSDLQ